MGAKTLPEDDEQQLNKKNKKKTTNKHKKKRERIRIFPIWLRIIVIIVLAFVALAGGLMFGYGVMGDGQATDVFKKETWQHIVNIVTEQ